MDKKDTIIECADGVRLAGTVYDPEKRIKAAVVIASALGVPRKFYRAFAMFLAGNGYRVVTFDYRGIVDSVAAGNKGREITMMDWGALDLDAALADTMGRLNGPVFLAGHSAGGQLSGMAAHSRQLSGIIFTPSSSANWRLYPAPFCFGLYALWHLLIPVMCVGRNYFPAKAIGIASMDAPAGVMRQWARWACQPDYVFSPVFGYDLAHYRELSAPILAYGFDDDRYASQQAIDHLLSQFPKAAIERHHLRASQLGVGTVGHFGFFKEKMRDSLWHQTLDWLNAKSLQT